MARLLRISISHTNNKVESAHVPITGILYLSKTIQPKDTNIHQVQYCTERNITHLFRTREQHRIVPLSVAITHNIFHFFLCLYVWCACVQVVVGLKDSSSSLVFLRLERTDVHVRCSFLIPSHLLASFLGRDCRGWIVSNISPKSHIFLPFL